MTGRQLCLPISFHCACYERFWRKAQISGALEKPAHAKIIEDVGRSAGGKILTTNTMAR